MQFNSITLILAYAIATGLVASPLKKRDSTKVATSNEYTELYREKASTSGFLVYYGPASGTKTLRSEAAKVEERAAVAYTTSSSLVCATSHSAPNGLCDNLVTKLQGDSQVSVGSSPRQIYYQGGSTDPSKYCCVSWGKAIPKLIKGDLANYA